MRVWFLLLVFFFPMFSGAITKMEGYTSDPAPACNEKLAQKLNPYEAVAELILLLSYDHPLVHNIAKRAKSVAELDIFLHLLWGFQLPVYVNPNLNLQDKEHLSAQSVYQYSLNGDLLFPIRHLRTRAGEIFKNEAFSGTSLYKGIGLEGHLGKEISEFLLPRIKLYSDANDWNKWKALSIEYRTGLATRFLDTTFQTFELLRRDKVALPEIDVRTGQQKIVYIHEDTARFNRGAFSLLTKKTEMNLPNNFDLILPTEMDQISRLMGILAKDKKAVKIATDYLAQYLPLLIHRRQEALPHPSKQAILAPAPSSIFNRIKWIPFSTKKAKRADTSEKDRILDIMLYPSQKKYDQSEFPTFLSKSSSVDQMIQAIQDTSGPYQARIHLHALHMTTTKTPAPAPEEITTIEGTEQILQYDINAIISMRTNKDLPAGKIEQQIKSIPDPVTDNLQSVVLIRSYGSDIFANLNLLTQNISALKAKTPSKFIEQLQDFNSELSTKAVTTSIQKFHALALSLTSFETYELSSHANTDQVEAETASFIAKIEQFLGALTDHAQRLDNQEILKLAALGKIEELQTVLLLSRSQILPGIQLRKKNHELLYQNVRQLQVLLASLITKSSFGSLTDEDVKSLSKSVQIFLSLLKGTDADA